MVPLSVRTDQRWRTRVDQDNVERDDPACRGATALAAEVGKHVARDADEVETGAIQRFDILLTQSAPGVAEEAVRSGTSRQSPKKQEA